MKTTKQIQAMIEAGQMDEAYKEVRRYGTITHDDEWEETVGHYRGFNRILCVMLNDVAYTFELLNGEVRSIDYQEM